MKRSRMLLAATSAAFFAAGVTGSALAEHHEGGEGKVHCEGVNSCKGQSACKTANNECSGQNSCKGKGWVEMTPEECEKAKAEMAS